MLTRDAAAFLAHARTLAPDFGPATAGAAFLVAPEGFARAQQSASDNRYMAGEDAFDAERAHAQHRGLQRALATVLPTVCFPGDPETPDAVFPNNVFATGNGRYLVGRMRHPVRQREAARADIRGFLGGLLGLEAVDLSTQPHPCELTGALVVDRARGLGFCGLSERCDADGARLMHEALGLRATLLFDLAPGEYHANVVLAVLAGRAALACPGGFADPAVVEAIVALYHPHGIVLSPAEHAAFAGNAIALPADTVWMSAGAEAALEPATREALAAAGLQLRSVPLDAIEAAGGSLRCCVAEVFAGPPSEPGRSALGRKRES
ncbi:MAG: amidinotransferase [Lysobacteraceae bacterium]|nr:MAG: amidinotransferase [Xanthomonadaceae bacterium]